MPFAASLGRVVCGQCRWHTTREMGKPCECDSICVLGRRQKLAVWVVALPLRQQVLRWALRLRSAFGRWIYSSRALLQLRACRPAANQRVGRMSRCICDRRSARRCSWSTRPATSTTPAASAAATAATDDGFELVCGPCHGEDYAESSATFIILYALD